MLKIRTISRADIPEEQRTNVCKLTEQFSDVFVHNSDELAVCVGIEYDEYWRRNQELID